MLATFPPVNYGNCLLNVWKTLYESRKISYLIYGCSVNVTEISCINVLLDPR